MENSPFRQEAQEPEPAICDKCIHVIRSGFIQLPSHQFSTPLYCMANKQGRDYVTGEATFKSCRELNKKGDCPKFEAKPIPIKKPPKRGFFGWVASLF